MLGPIPIHVQGGETSPEPGPGGSGFVTVTDATPQWSHVGRTRARSDQTGRAGRLACCVLECAGVCWSVLECAGVCCCVLLCAAVCCSVLQCAAVCCCVLLCAAVCCSVLQCAAVCCCVLLCAAVCCSVLQCAAVCCSVLQCAAVCWSVLLCAAVCWSVLLCAAVSRGPVYVITNSWLSGAGPAPTAPCLLSVWSLLRCR
jgi:hypothetical protein